MKQAIAGVAPPQAGETPIMTVWPSIAARPEGRFIGRCCMIGAGPGRIFNVGKIMALLLAPMAAGLYLARFIIPVLAFVGTFGLASAASVCERYTLTNRRLILQHGLLPKDAASIKLGDFDRIEIRTQPGYEWFPAGDLVFFNGPTEVFSLAAVPRPETFRRACLKTRDAYVAVGKFVAA